MKIIGLQTDIVWENKPANFEKVRGLLRQAPPGAGNLVVLPELFATGFSMNTALTGEPPGGETEQFLSQLAKEYSAYFVAGAALRDRQGCTRNNALIFGSDGVLLGCYAKMRPFTPGAEHEHYTAGEHPVTFQWGGCEACPFVCYDLRFPELFRQAAAAHRPKVFIVIANWPQKRVSHWIRLLQARAIENQAYIIGVNRVGTDPFYSYNGHSLIADFNGEVMTDAGEREGPIFAELDLEQLEKYRQGLPFLQDLKV